MRLILKIILQIAFFNCFLFFSILNAQDKTTLEVSAIDQNLSVIKQISVKLKTVKGQIIKETETNKSTTFIFSDLIDEDYVLEVSSVGFKTSIKKIKIFKGKNLTTVKLEIEEIKANIEVTKNEVEERVDGALNANLSQESINSLPDNPNEIADELKRRYGEDIVIRVNGFTGGQIPSKEQIASIRVTRSSFDSQFHQIGQTTVDIKTRADDQVFFGFANASYNNSFLNSRNPIATKRLPSQNTNVFGVLVFPTINKNRTAFSLQFINFFSSKVNNIIAIVPNEQISKRIKTGSSNINLSFIANHNLSKHHTLNVGYTVGKNNLSNLGVGDLNLAERAYSNDSISHNIRLLESGNIKTTASQFRLEFSDINTKNIANNQNLSIDVIGVFYKGGAGINNKNHEQKLLLSEIIYYDYLKNSFKFGTDIEYENRKQESSDNLFGTFVFSSLVDFLNNRPYSFTQRRATTAIKLSQIQLAGFVQDDIRLYKNFQIGLGLRYERQNNFKDNNNFSPRLSFVWSPDKEAKVVIRSGVGVFYKWFDTTPLSTILSNDGRNGGDLIIINPSYPNPATGGIIGNSLPPSITKKDDNLRNPDTFISKTVINYRINNKFNLESIYTFKRSVHQFRSRDINSPINGVRPNSLYGRITQVESSGNSKENALELKFDGSLKKGFSFDAIYKLGKIKSDFEDIFSLPTNSYNTSLENSVSNLDQRHKFSTRLSFPSWKNLSLSTTFRLESPRPYTITTGRDDNGDSVINDRPTGIGRNSVRGDWFKQIDANFSWKTKLGREDAKNPLSKIKNQIVFTTTIQNLFNQTNLQNFVGIQTSPFFRQATSANSSRNVQFGLSYIF